MWQSPTKVSDLSQNLSVPQLQMMTGIILESRYQTHTPNYIVVSFWCSCNFTKGKYYFAINRTNQTKHTFRRTQDLTGKNTIAIHKNKTKYFLSSCFGVASLA